MKTTIRTAVTADASQIARLSLQLGYPTSTEDVRRRLARLKNRKDHRVIVATHEDRAVAWLHVCRKEPLEIPGYAEISALVVGEAYRGRGIGAELVQKAERWAKSAGLQKFRVRSNVNRKRTKLFYQNLGFRVTKTQSVFDKTVGRRRTNGSSGRRLGEKYPDCRRRSSSALGR